MHDRFNDSGYRNLFILQALDPDRRPVGEHRRPVPAIEDEHPSRLEVLPDGGKGRPEVVVAGLITHDMKEGDHRIEGFAEPDGPQIALVKIKGWGLRLSARELGGGHGQHLR